MALKTGTLLISNLAEETTILERTNSYHERKDANKIAACFFSVLWVRM